MPKATQLARGKAGTCSPAPLALELTLRLSRPPGSAGCDPTVASGQAGTPAQHLLVYWALLHGRCVTAAPRSEGEAKAQGVSSTSQTVGSQSRRWAVPLLAAAGLIGRRVMGRLGLRQWL